MATNNRDKKRPAGRERIRTLTIHHGRHTFISHALAGGRTLAEVRDAAGHSSVLVTSAYLHVAVEDDGAVGSLFRVARGPARTCTWRSRTTGRLATSDFLWRGRRPPAEARAGEGDRGAGVGATIEAASGSALECSIGAERASGEGRNRRGPRDYPCSSTSVVSCQGQSASAIGGNAARSGSAARRTRRFGKNGCNIWPR